MAPKSEFYWEGADGTTIYASRLGQRPRYNMWYIICLLYTSGPNGSKIMSEVKHGDIIRYVTNSKGELVDYVKAVSYTHLLGENQCSAFGVCKW